MKTCKTCNKNLRTTNFHKQGKKLKSDCKQCLLDYKKTLNYPCIEGYYICVKCKIEQHSNNFNKCKENINGYEKTCKKCRKNIQRKSLSKFNVFIKNLYADITRHAEDRKIEVYITIDNIIDKFISQDGLCMLSNIKMTHCFSEKTTYEQVTNPYNISVDRIDSSKHYTIDNIQLVCVIVNRMKHVLENDHFLLLCAAVKDHNEKNISLIKNYLNTKQSKQVIIIDSRHQKYMCSYEGYTKNLHRRTLNNAKKRVKKKEFLLTLDNIRKLYKDNPTCRFSGINLTMLGYQNKGLNMYNMSVDRINYDKGYTVDNIQAVCAIINIMKNDQKDDAFINMCTNIATFNADKILKYLEMNPINY